MYFKNRTVFLAKLKQKMFHSNYLLWNNGKKTSKTYLVN